MRSWDLRNLMVAKAKRLTYYKRMRNSGAKVKNARGQVITLSPDDLEKCIASLMSEMREMKREYGSIR